MLSFILFHLLSSQIPIKELLTTEYTIDQKKKIKESCSLYIIMENALNNPKQSNKMSKHSSLNNLQR